MMLPNLYNYGTLFAFSGLEGENSHDDDFVAMTMETPVELRFDAKQPVTLRIPVKSAEMDFILSDVLQCEELLLVFADQTTVLGKTAIPPELFAEGDAAAKKSGGLQILCANGFSYALLFENGRFAFCREKDPAAAAAGAKEKITRDIDALCKEKLAYYQKLPPCPRVGFERLYYKCLSVNRVNVYSPQGGVNCRATTPDRLPHHHVWLWDSMFHALSFVQYDPAMAKDSILAVLQCQQADGFIPHMMKSKTDVSAITQPQVIAWAALEVYRKTGDKRFLAQCADPIAAFLLWFQKNRDNNGNGLFEWKTDFSNVRCRCDESGMDNSPRFDTTETLDAIDCSTFMVNDCRCLAEIYQILGNNAQAQRFQTIADETSQRINELLWDEKNGCYCDRSFSGKLTGVFTCASFLPLFAGVCSPAQAERLAALLKDPHKFGAPLPVPSVARDDPAYGTDMWRGGVWLNFNYFVVKGLQRYGFDALADDVAEKTLQAVRRWFLETGNVFEFYDAENKTAPWKMNRKGPQPPTPDYRIHYHAITDFNWSACFTLLLLWETGTDPGKT